MGNVFNTVQVRKPNDNTFKHNHDVKFSASMGVLTPILLQEVLPGDKFSIQTETLIRFAPLVSPVMHNIQVYTHYFYVPNRILWKNWEKFISPDLSKDVPPAPPVLTWTASGTSMQAGSLWDYLGLPEIPSGLTPSQVPKISALPFAAYQRVWYEFFRDQNLQTDLPLVELTDGNNVFDGKLSGLRRRSWQHDYFTACLPFAQKGPAVDIPIEGIVSVADGASSGSWRQVVTGNPAIQAPDGPNFADDAFAEGQLQDGTNVDLYYDPNGSLVVDSGNATINDLRTAFRLQEFFEKAARGGSRYIEQMMVHWNVRSSDARLNRPEFIGGTKNPVIISEVLQTSSSDETSPQATMAGHGLSAGSGRTVRYTAEEHGYIIGIMSVMPSTAYQQGTPRHFTRSSWEDYAWPTFAHLGEQPVLNQEIYTANDGLNEGTFGYIPRYSEYRYTPSRVAGDFRNSLAFWHLGRIFATRPNLNATFISCDPRKDIFAVEGVQHLWCHSFHKVFVRRKLPKYGTPTL